jgi:hypothetical protein
MRDRLLSLLRMLLLVALIAAGVSWVPLQHADRAYERARRDFEYEVGSLDVATLNLGDIPDSANAAIRLLQGADAMVFAEGDLANLKRLSGDPSASWSQEDRLAASRLLSANASALDLLRDARHLSQSSWGASPLSSPPWSLSRSTT